MPTSTAARPICTKAPEAPATLLHRAEALARGGWEINGATGLYLDRTPTGWGVFAAKPFGAGEHILTFSGPELTLSETLALGAWSMYPVQIGADQFVDCAPPGAFMNHSCDPNAGIRDSVRLVARRLIRPGEQIMMDYSTCMSGDPEAGMPCRCGSESCRRVIGNFEDLSEPVQRAYLENADVAEFIVRILKANLASTSSAQVADVAQALAAEPFHAPADGSSLSGIHSARFRETTRVG